MVPQLAGADAVNTGRPAAASGPLGHRMLFSSLRQLINLLIEIY
jgi:hypothetical protein